MKRNILTVPVHEVRGSASTHAQDLVAVEEPLEIRLGNRPISVTMRTPGNDIELAIGFLFGEGILRSAADIVNVEAGENRVTIKPTPGLDVSTARLERNFYMSSSCGVCGKASIDAVHSIGRTMLPRNGFAIRPEVIHQLPGELRSAQNVFSHTGGLHAAGLFTSDGTPAAVREDVGRHTAVDKVIGAEVLAGRTPLSQHVLLVSGRASFELAQKALMGGIPLLAAVGAPSSLAVALAQRFQMTLLGFVRDDRYNVYSGEWRIK